MVENRKAGWGALPRAETDATHLRDAYASEGCKLDWLQRQMGHEDLQTLIRHYWRYINPQRLSTEVVARLEALGSEQSRAENAQLMPNSMDSSAKSTETTTSEITVNPLNH